MVVVLMILFMVSGCSHYEDTNGDDPSLQTITLEKMASTSTSFMGSGATITSRRENFTTVMQYEDIDLDYLKMVGGKYSGVKSAVAFEINENDVVTIEVTTNVTIGNLGVILISPTHEIIYEFDLNTTDTYTLTAEEEGIYFIRIGTESFGGTLEITRTFE